MTEEQLSPEERRMGFREAARLRRTLNVWTDGACFPNPGRGGWAWVTHGHSGSGTEPSTTNQRMELTAIIRAIEAQALNADALQIYTDSRYCVGGAMFWLKNWKKNGWKTRSGESVKNQDLWGALSLLLDEIECSFRWVRGHSGNEMNEKADHLAALATGLDSNFIRKCQRRYA